MASHREGYTAQKPSVKGATLLSVVITAVIITVVLAGLYFMLTRLLGTSESARVYSSTREAAVAGVYRAITSGAIESITYNLPCPDGNNPVNRCCNLTFPFRVQGFNAVFQNNVQVCFVGYAQVSGYQVTGVAYSRPIGSKGYVFRIISSARGPQNSTAQIETLYTP